MTAGLLGFCPSRPILCCWLGMMMMASGEEVFCRRRWSACYHNKCKLDAPPQAALFHIFATTLRRRRGELKRRWAKNCCLKTVWRPRRARVKARVGQKLLPKDCLPAAPGASESPGGPKTAP